MLCVIQARISSKRLPKKMFYKIKNKSILELVVNQVKKARKVNDIIIATSSDKSDNKIEEFCKQKKIDCFRGSLPNVAKRFLHAAQKKQAKVFLRVNADSPLIDPKLIDGAISMYKEKYDLVTNTFPKFFPKGQSVEIIKTSTFKRVVNKMKKRQHKEHVTKYYYDNPKDFFIFSILCSQNYSNINLSVDTKKDFVLIKKIYRDCKNKIGGWKDLIKVYKNLE